MEFTIDGNLYGINVAKVREILPDVDLLKISEEEADMLGGEAELPALQSELGRAAGRAVYDHFHPKEETP